MSFFPEPTRCPSRSKISMGEFSRAMFPSSRMREVIPLLDTVMMLLDDCTTDDDDTTVLLLDDAATLLEDERNVTSYLVPNQFVAEPL